MNQTQFAAKIGVSQNTIARYIRTGIIKKGVKKKGRKIDIKPNIAKKEIKENVNVSYRPQSGPTMAKNDPKVKEIEKAESEKPGLMQFKSVDAQYAAALRKIKYEEQTGKLILKSKVDETVFRATRIFRDTLLNIGPRISPILAAEKDKKKVMVILDREIKSALKDLEEGLARI